MPTSENKMAVYNIASTALVAGINFITIPIFTRMLDTGGYGIVNVYVAWVQICAIFVGLKSDGSVGSAHANLPEGEQDSYHWSILLMAFASFAVILVLALVLLDPISRLLGMEGPLVIAMVLQSFGTFVVSLFSMRFIFSKEPQKNFALSVGICVATTLASVALVASGFFGTDAYMGRVVGLSAPYLVVGVGLLFAMARRRSGFHLGYWKFCLLLTVPLIFHGLSQILLAQTGKIAIQQYDGNSVAGIYSIAVTVAGLLNAIYTALNNAYVPFMYDDLAGKSAPEAKLSHFNNYFYEFTAGTVAFAMVSPEILKIMSTEAYWSSLEVLPLLTIGQYCVFLYSFPVNFEFYSMRTRWIAVGTCLAAVLNLVLCYVLVPLLGMYGAALATMASYVALFLFHLCTARFLLGDRNYPVWKFFAGLACVAAASLLYYPLADAPVIRWAVGVVGLAYVVVRIVRNRRIF